LNIVGGKALPAAGCKSASTSIPPVFGPVATGVVFADVLVEGVAAVQDTMLINNITITATGNKVCGVDLFLFIFISSFIFPVLLRHFQVMIVDIYTFLLVLLLLIIEVLHLPV
jgi:hypothetical protein